MHKKLNFSLIEVIVAFSLVSIAISFLFISLKKFTVLNMQVNRYLPKIIEQEKGYFYLKNLTERIFIDKTHPINFVENSVLSFYFYPSIFDEEEKLICYFAKCIFSDAALKVEVYKPHQDKIELLSSTVLIDKLHEFQLIKDSNPEVIFIHYTTCDDVGSWTFFLDPYIVLKT